MTTCQWHDNSKCRLTGILCNGDHGACFETIDSGDAEELLRSEA